MKTLSFLSVIVMMFLGPSKCTEDQKIQKNPPMSLGEVNVENLTLSTESDESGFNLYIPINDNPRAFTLDSVYFRNQIVKLIKKTANSQTFYVGAFKNRLQSGDDIIMSSDPMEEMKNVPPAVPKKLPFKLADTEAIVSYQEDGKLKYFKIEHIKEKSSDMIPKSEDEN